MKNRLTSTLLLFFAFILFNPNANACTEPPPQPDVEIRCMSNGILYLIFKDYISFAEANGTCACGLNLPNTLGTVIDFKMVYANTMDEVPWFNFNNNSNTANGYNALEPGDWSGFSSNILEAIPSGESVDLIFCIQPVQSQPVQNNRDTQETCDMAANDINDYILSQTNLIGTSGADSDGTPQSGHTNIVSANPTIVSVPTLSQWGLLLLFLLLITLGTVLLTQQQQSQLSTTTNAPPIPTKTPLFQPQLFQNLVLKSLPLMLVIIALISYLEGALFLRNIWGTILCGLVLVYLLHFIQVNHSDKNAPA